LIALLLAAALSFVSHGMPIPPEYQGNTHATIVTLTPDEIQTACGNDDPAHWTIYGCAFNKNRRIIMPNPCTYPEVTDIDSYAYLACHELAHINGFKHPR
jgi:hypothetical protein